MTSEELDLQIKAALERAYADGGLYEAFLKHLSFSEMDMK